MDGHTPIRGGLRKDRGGQTSRSVKKRKTRFMLRGMKKADESMGTHLRLMRRFGGPENQKRILLSGVIYSF